MAQGCEIAMDDGGRDGGGGLSLALRASAWVLAETTRMASSDVAAAPGFLEIFFVLADLGGDAVEFGDVGVKADAGGNEGCGEEDDNSGKRDGEP